MVVDGDMNELPSCSHRAGGGGAEPVAGDAVADGIEPAELLDVEMNDLAGGFPLITRLGSAGSMAESRLSPRCLRMRLTVDCDRLSCLAIAAWVWRCRRKTLMASQVACGVWLDNDSGREERSCSPAAPSVRKRSTHLPTVLWDVWKRCAASALVRP